MYRIGDYDDQINDHVRREAYLTALRRAIRPGDVVLEIGTGVGFFAVAAALAGARRVFAVERSSGPALAVAREMVAANGVADRVELIHGSSREITLPERADVYVGDLRGALPFLGDHIATIVDARARHLKPDARLIPTADHLWIAPTTAEPLWRERRLPDTPLLEGVDRTPLLRRLRDAWWRARLRPDALLAAPQQFATLDWRTVTDPNVDATIPFEVTASGTMDGWCVWFSADLGHGVALDSGPGAPPVIWAQAFFPLTYSVAVQPGDQVRCDFSATLIGDEYLFAWESRLRTELDAGTPAHFRQSNLFELPGTPRGS
jgi:protein arginine N-methyltransferase 1